MTLTKGLNDISAEPMVIFDDPLKKNHSDHSIRVKVIPEFVTRNTKKSFEYLTKYRFP